MVPDKKTIWITWENHRRTIELANALDIKLYKIVHNGNKYIRSLISAFKTLIILITVRPAIVIAQNPSVQLAFIVSFLKNSLKYKLIIDRHSNFDFKNLNDGLFNRMSNYSIRKADITIVTNQYIKKLIKFKGGRAYVLEDKLPDLNLKRQISMNGKHNIVFICTFSPDEPVNAIIEAARHLNKDIQIYITGNYKKISNQIIQNAPKNIIFTGFLNEADYQSLLYSADILIILTTREHTLLCGAYEGVSLSKPLIISNKDALKNYFYKGVVLTENDSSSIKNAIVTAINKYVVLKKEVEELKNELKQDWEKKFENLKSLINNL